MKRTSHILHLIMTILTSGLWAFVWLICALRNAQYNKERMYIQQKEHLDVLKRIADKGNY
jgi:hypothetical protein